MASLSISIRELLVALYFEHVSTGKDRVPSSILKDAYDFDDLLGRYINGLLDHGLAEPAVFDGEADSTAIALTKLGMNRARQLVLSGDRAKKLTSFSDGTTFSDGSRFSTLVPPDDFELPGVETDPEHATHDSSAWTGLKSDFVLSEEKRVQLINLLQDVEERLGSLEISNSEKSQVRALVIASRMLADAPEPPAEIIWELLNRASQIAGIAALLVSIFGLFK